MPVTPVEAPYTIVLPDGSGTITLPPPPSPRDGNESFDTGFVLPPSPFRSNDDDMASM